MQGDHLAIIDLGTNTFHLMIVEIDERDDYRIVEKYKEPVKLGEGGITSGKIGTPAFRRGIKALKKFRKLIDSKRCNDIRAYATSAIRSANNGQEFIQKAKEEASIDIRIINGNEEAALIFEGIRNGIQLPMDQDTLLIDIGGGSVEFIVTRDNKAQFLRSINLGAARLLEMVKPSDPMTAEDISRLQAIIREKCSGLLEELKEFHCQSIVGSSGSFETMASIIANMKGDHLSSENLNSYSFSFRDYHRAHQKLQKSTQTERLALPGMDPMRVDMIVMGSMIIEVFAQELAIKQFMVSTFALKEGILNRYIDEQKERVHIIMGNTGKNVRAKSIRGLCEKYNYDKVHCLKVSELALQIYDQLTGLHPFGKQERELLRYSALLHDIGYFINRSSHHKHGQYIIMNSGISGFSHDEVVILGNVVRYHRKSLPTRDHFHYKILDPKHRLMVRLLAGVLRIADHLDRGHRNFVDSVRLETDKHVVRMLVFASDTVDIELQSAMNERELLEQTLDRPLMIEQAGMVGG
jgi:exopolyphosphatase/guanosine-5'-triphosphate,3'-diphosphate pyrophosphatase